MLGFRFLESTSSKRPCLDRCFGITPNLAQAKIVISSKSTRALPGLLLEKQCGESQVAFHSSHFEKTVCLNPQTLSHPHFPCPSTALLSLAVALCRAFYLNSTNASTDSEEEEGGEGWVPTWTHWLFGKLRAPNQN